MYSSYDSTGFGKGLLRAADDGYSDIAAEDFPSRMVSANGIFTFHEKSVSIFRTVTVNPEQAIALPVVDWSDGLPGRKVAGSDGHLDSGFTAG